MASADISREDLERALEFVGAVQAAPDLDSYRRAVLGIDSLVPGHIVAYNEIDLDSGEVLAIAEPPVLEPRDYELFERYHRQNPLLDYHARTGETAPRALSDLITAEELHETELYRQFYSRHGVEDQIAIILPSPPGKLNAVVLNRGERGFSDRERALLELVRPHLLQAFRMVSEAERSRGEISELRQRLERIADPVAEAAETYGLTERQAEVLRLIAAGHDNKEIAERLDLAATTVVKHGENIRVKVGAATRVEMVARVLGHPYSG